MEKHSGLEYLSYATLLAISAAVGLLVRIAVSYTHLRAHETVLDLVCRLLLEKKLNERHRPHLLS